MKEDISPNTEIDDHSGRSFRGGERFNTSKNRSTPFHGKTWYEKPQESGSGFDAFDRLAKVIATTFQLIVEQGLFERRLEHNTGECFEEKKTQWLNTGNPEGTRGARLSHSSSR